MSAIRATATSAAKKNLKNHDRAAVVAPRFLAEERRFLADRRGASGCRAIRQWRP
jgi:hypothetical protein